jgi:hypothetical protein
VSDSGGRSNGRFNEGRALDAVLRRIEERDGCRRGDDVRSPERERHAAPIDLACTMGGRLFAFEHTGIEPFPGQIEGEEHSRSLFRPIADGLAGALPSAESFELHVPVDATVGLRRGEVPQIRDAIVRWVRETAPTLPIAPYGRYITPIRKLTLPGVPFPVSLHRFAAMGPMRGRFSVVHLVSGDLETARLDRISEACAKKFGKLAEWKRSYGALTVLVLEEADIQLTNAQRVAEALARAEDSRADRPDEVYLVSTSLDDLWHVTCLRREGRDYYDDGERFWPIDPAALVSLTER